MSLRKAYINTQPDNQVQGSLQAQANNAYIRHAMNTHLQELSGVIQGTDQLRAKMASKPSTQQLKPNKLCTKFGQDIDKALASLRSQSGALASLGNYSQSLRVQRDILRSVSTRKQRLLKAVQQTLKKAYLNKEKNQAYL